MLPLGPRQIERCTHDYERHGTTSLLAALELKTSLVIGQLHRRHRSQEFRRFLSTIEPNVPAGLDIHIVMDNYERTRQRSSRTGSPGYPTTAFAVVFLAA